MYEKGLFSRVWYLLPCQPNDQLSKNISISQRKKQQRDIIRNLLSVSHWMSVFTCGRVSACSICCSFVPFMSVSVWPQRAPSLPTPTGHLLHQIHAGTSQADRMNRWSAQTVRLYVHLPSCQNRLKMWGLEEASHSAKGNFFLRRCLPSPIVHSVPVSEVGTHSNELPLCVHYDVRPV